MSYEQILYVPSSAYDGTAEEVIKKKEMPVSELVRRFVDAGLEEEKKPEIYKQDENTTSLSSE